MVHSFAFCQMCCCNWLLVHVGWTGKGACFIKYLVNTRSTSHFMMFPFTVSAHQKLMCFCFIYMAYIPQMAFC